MRRLPRFQAAYTVEQRQPENRIYGQSIHRSQQTHCAPFSGCPTHLGSLKPFLSNKMPKITKSTQI
nr:hypothetical protein [uncultured Kingella sp.]